MRKVGVRWWGWSYTVATQGRIACIDIELVYFNAINTLIGLQRPMVTYIELVMSQQMCFICYKVINAHQKNTVI